MVNVSLSASSGLKVLTIPKNTYIKTNSKVTSYANYSKVIFWYHIYVNLMKSNNEIFEI